MAEQKVKLTDLPAATDTIDTAQLLINQNSTDQKLPITHFLRAKNNLSELTNIAQARANLDVPSVDEVDSKLTGFIDGSYTFSSGGSLASRNDFIWDEESKSWYYWSGTLPKEVPAASNPGSTGGVAEGAWTQLSDSALRVLLASDTGAQQIGTNHRGTLQQDLDVIDIRTSGQAFDTLITTPKDVEIDTSLTVSTKTIGAVAIKGRPQGSVSVSKDTTKQIRGFDFTERGVVLDSVSISGSNVLPGDSWATFCTYIEPSSGKATYINSEFKDATAAVNCEGDNTVFAFNRISGMVEHASIDAGGYGFLTGGVTDTLIIGNSADAAGGDPDSPLRSRHFAYISDYSGGKVNTGVRIIGNYADWRRVSQAKFSAPTIKGRGQNGLLIANNQLRGGNIPVHVTADFTDVLRVTVTGNQFLNYEKNVTNHPCAGVWLYATPARDYIREFIISNNIYAATRSVSTDFARTVNGVWLQKTTQGVISDSTMRLPGLAVPVSMEDTSRVIVSNIEDFTGDANPSPFFAFAGACSDITVSNILTNRAIYGADVSNVTDLTVDYQRKLILLSTNGTITNSDPHLLMQSASVTGTGEITVVFRSHVTTKALDAIAAKGNRIAGPHVFMNRSGKSLVCTIYNASGAIVPLSTSTVGIDFILSS